MVLSFFSKKRFLYSILDNPSNPTPRAYGQFQHYKRPILALIASFVILAIATASYGLGKLQGGYQARMDWLSTIQLQSNGFWQLRLIDWKAPVGLIDHTFQYHSLFASEPTEANEHTWNIMFPRGRGFVQHPIISPDPMGLAVYHQLHCLDAIRRGYYGARAGDLPNNHTAPGHIRHCIDYLRQALLCNADTNLEPIDPVLKGVVGFNVTRKCRDPVKLLQWADKWRTHNQTSIT